MQELSAPQIPNFVTARSPLGLRRVMLLNNAKHRKVFNYYSIHFVDGKWFAWFYNEVESGDDLLNPDEHNKMKAKGEL
jgi:hypothetical protein